MSDPEEAPPPEVGAGAEVAATAEVTVDAAPIAEAGEDVPTEAAPTMEAAPLEEGVSTEEVPTEGAAEVESTEQEGEPAELLESTEAAEAAKSHPPSEAKAEALVRGMSRQQLGRLLSDAFDSVDEDGNGMLDHTEFAKCFEGLNLTAEEIDKIAKSCDTDHDGFIAYKEFLPLAYEMLVQNVAETMVSLCFKFFYHPAFLEIHL
jgi:hypothetical protein